MKQRNTRKNIKKDRVPTKKKSKRKHTRINVRVKRVGSGAGFQVGDQAGSNHVEAFIMSKEKGVDDGRGRVGVGHPSTRSSN